MCVEYFLFFSVLKLELESSIQKGFSVLDFGNQTIFQDDVTFKKTKGTYHWPVKQCTGKFHIVDISVI